MKICNFLIPWKDPARSLWCLFNDAFQLRHSLSPKFWMVIFLILSESWKFLWLFLLWPDWKGLVLKILGSLFSNWGWFLSFPCCDSLQLFSFLKNYQSRIMTFTSKVELLNGLTALNIRRVCLKELNYSHLSEIGPEVRIPEWFQCLKGIYLCLNFPFIESPFFFLLLRSDAS